MTERRLGFAVPDFTPPPAPGETLMTGRFAQLERLDPERHAAALFGAFAEDPGVWDYLPYGPFATEAEFTRWLSDTAATRDPYFYAVRDLETGQVGGVMSYLRITPEMGTIELGHINFAPQLQRTRAATEAMVLMISWAFGVGYRRFEWKCDSLNLNSRRAAQRLGLSYEGVFRQAAVIKGRNRDTAWFAATDDDWPALKVAYEAWLAPSNFDKEGRQFEHLTELTLLLRVSSDPILGKS